MFGQDAWGWCGGVFAAIMKSAPLMIVLGVCGYVLCLFALEWH